MKLWFLKCARKIIKKYFLLCLIVTPTYHLRKPISIFSSLNSILENIDNEKPIGIVLTGDFNARSSYFWGDDADTREGQILSEMSIFINLEQLICERTHVRDDGSQSCIDLIFTNQRFAFTDVQIIPHSEKQFKHLIVYGKINFSVPCQPPYKRKICDYSHANYANISEVLNNIDWVNIILNENVDEITTCFFERLMLVMSENISNKIVTCSDKDALWINIEVKSAIRRNSRVYQKWVLTGRNSCTKDNVRKVQNDTNRRLALKHSGKLLNVL